MEDCGRSRRSQLPATFPLIVLLFREDFFTGESISDGISRERKYPPVSRLFPPSLDEIGFRWPPNVFRYSFLIGSLRSTLDLPPPPAIALHFFENVFSHLSFLPFFFLSVLVFEQKRRWQVRCHFSTDRPPLLLFPFSLFLSSFHSSSPRGCTPVFRRREVNKGEAREGGAEERMARPPRVTVFKNFQRAT